MIVMIPIFCYGHRSMLLHMGMLLYKGHLMECRVHVIFFFSFGLLVLSVLFLVSLALKEKKKIKRSALYVIPSYTKNIGGRNSKKCS